MRTGRLAGLIGLFAFLVRLAFVAVSSNADVDGVLRFRTSRLVISPGLWLPTDIWLPVHFWVLAVPRVLGLTGSFWQRVMTAGASGAAVAFGTCVAARVFPRLAAAVIGILLALNPLDIHMAAITVAEPWVLLGVTGGLAAFLGYVEQGGAWRLSASVGAFWLACGVRFEPWVVLPLLPLLVYWSDPLLGRAMPDGAMRRAWHVTLGASVVPLAWSAYSAWRWGDPLYLLTLNATRVHGNPAFQRSSALDVVTFWPAMLLVALGPVAVAAAAGASRLIRDGGPRLTILLFGGLLALYYVFNFEQTLTTDVRYGILLVWLAIPGVAGWLEGPVRHRRAAVLIASAALWLGTMLVVAEEWPAAPVLVRSISPLPRWIGREPVPDE